MFTLKKLGLDMENKQYSKREILSALAAYSFLALIICVFTFGFFKACADEAAAQEQQAKEWQQRFERGEPVEMKARVGGAE